MKIISDLLTKEECEKLGEIYYLIRRRDYILSKLDTKVKELQELNEKDSNI